MTTPQTPEQAVIHTDRCTQAGGECISPVACERYQAAPGQIRHCAVCNLIVGTHSLNFCTAPEWCGCWCIEDDGTFPKELSQHGEPRLMVHKALELIREQDAERAADKALLAAALPILQQVLYEVHGPPSPLRDETLRELADLLDRCIEAGREGRS